MSSQLILAHHGDRLLQRARRPVVEIWRSQFYVPQTWNFEHISIPLVSRDIEPAKISPGDIASVGKIVGHYAESLEHIAADASSLVTTDASISLENLVALLLVGTQS